MGWLSLRLLAEAGHVLRSIARSTVSFSLPLAREARIATGHRTRLSVPFHVRLSLYGKNEGTQHEQINYEHC